MKLAARIEGVGLLGPGFANWEEGREVLAGRAPFALQPTKLPAPDALPATERRRAGRCVRASLAAGLEAAAAAKREPRALAAIFASSGGDGENLHSICETLASDDRSISPTRFHNSVHNAPAGYWGIATGAMLPSDTIAAFDASFGAGLLEAAGRIAADPATPVLLMAYDAPYPEPLNAKRPMSDAFAVAFVLSSAGAGGTGIGMSMELTADTPAALPDAALEGVRRTIPAARALPLLRLLAMGGDGRTVIEYLDGMSIAVELHP